MKKDRIVKSLIALMGWVCCSLIFGSGVMAQGTVNGTDAVGVAYRGHIQDYGNRPADEAWVDGDAQLGTTGESKRIEGFWIKLTGTENLPAGAGIRYNVHVQNVGWLASTDLTKTETWVENGNFAGSQSKSQRVEAIQIVLTGADGKVLPGYSVQYQVHIQDYGWSQGWKADGDIAGTSGESKRLEAIQIKIVKTATDPAADKSVVYDQAGTNGPATGTQTIAGDVTVAADGVMLQNLVIQGDLTISEAVGDGTVTLNNVTVAGDTFVRGGGKNSIHINGGSYQNIVMEKTASGAVRIVAKDVDGMDVVISEDATGETIILEGTFDSVTVNAPNMTVTTQGDTTIAKMAVSEAGTGSTLNLGAQTIVNGLELDAKTSVTGQGTVKEAAVKSDGVSFEKAPVQQTVAPEVTVPPVVTPAVPPVVPPVTPPAGGGGGGGGYTPPSKIALSISDPTVTLSRVYDGTRNAAVTATGTLTGIETGDIVQVTATASYDSKNVGTGKTITVTYALAGANASKYSAPVDKIITGGTILAVPLMVSGTTITPTKEYDGTTAASCTMGTIVGKITNDVVTVDTATVYNTKDISTAKTVTLTYTLSGADAGNYTAPTGAAIANGEITRKTLTVSDSGWGIQFDKVYDGTTDMPGLVGAIASTAINGVVSGETVVVNPMGGTSVDPNVGVHDINVSFSLSGTDKDHYQISSKTITGKIAPIQLTATAAEVTTNKTYDGKTTAVITDNGAFGGILGSDNGKVTVTPTASYDNQNVGIGKTITVSYALSGDAAGNYTKPQGDELTTGVITAKPLTIDDPTPISKPYDGDTTAKVTVGNLIGVESGDSANVTVAADASYDNKNAGTNKTVTVVYTLDGSAAANYTKPGNDVLETGEITKIQLTAKLNSITTEKVYNGSNSVAATCSGLDEVLDVYNPEYNSYKKELVSINLDVHYDTEDVGDNKTITINYPLNDTEAAKNYLAPVTETRSGKIIPIQLTATGVVVTPTKIYDSGTTAAITNAVTIGGIVSGETLVNVTAVANYNDASVGDNKTITVSFNKSGEGNENYTVPAFYAVTTAGEITKKDLGALIGNSVNKIRYYDGTTDVQVTPGTFAGVCAGDDVLPKTTASFETAEWGSGKKVTVTVIPEGADMANYTGGNSVTVLTDGQIKQKPLSITDPMLTTSKEWDGNTSAAVVSLGTLSGVVGSEDVTVTAVAKYDSVTIGTDKTISVVYTLDGTAAGNYVKPTDYNCQTAVIYQGFGVQKATYDGSAWSGFTDVTVTKPPTGYTIFAVDNAGTVYASASNGSIQQLSGSTWSDEYSGTLPQGNFKLAGIDHASSDIAMGIDNANGKVYNLDGTTWKDSNTPITLSGYQCVGAYSTDNKSNFYLVFNNGIQLGQVDLWVITPIATLATSPTIPAGYHICGFNYTDGKLNCYICK